MNKHTPGPWTVNIPNNRETAIRGIHGGDYVIADILNDGYEDDEQEANARLIAASPDMLEALRRVANLNENAGEIGDGMLRTIVAEARAAIAKAEGHSNA